MNPQNFNPQQPSPMGQAMQQQSQDQQPTPSIDPQLLQSIIDNLKDQSQQIEKQQNQLIQSNDAQSQQAGQMLKQKQMTISKALGQLQPTSKNQQVQVGGALNTNNYSNMCLAFVDDQTGNKNRQPTAYADYQVNAQAGNIKTSGMPPKGARVYFAPTPDNPAGHVGLSLGGGKFRGATTSNGIQDFSIKNWGQYAGQQYLGYAMPSK